KTSSFDGDHHAVIGRHGIVDTLDAQRLSELVVDSGFHDESSWLASHFIWRSGAHTSSRSPGRLTSAYSTGIRKTLINSRVNRPLTITSANGRCESVPTPVASATGSRPNAATSAVIMIGRNRRIAPWRMASPRSVPSRRSSLTYEMYTTAVCTDTPNSARKPMPEDTENGVLVSHSATIPPTGADNSTPATVMSGNFRLP